MGGGELDAECPTPSANAAQHHPKKKNVKVALQGLFNTATLSSSVQYDPAGVVW